MIDELNFPGYFLVVYDIVRFCREQDIYCQGRGSAANSAVCYALRITNVDAVRVRAALRAVPGAGAGRPAGHRRGHRVGPARGGHPVRLRRSTAGSTPRRSPTSSRTGRGRRCGTWPRRSASRPGSRTRGASRSTGGAASATVDVDDIPEQVVAFANELQTFPAAPGHPLRRHGDLRPAGHRGVPGGVGADAGPHGAAVGQGRLRRGRPGQVRPAGARACCRRCTTRTT